MEVQHDEHVPCHPCALFSLRCDDDRPCSRCNRKGLQESCVDNDKHQFDQTGQICPPGMNPRVTCTLWEEESTLVFHVHVYPEDIQISRREDQNMINVSPLVVMNDKLRAVTIEAELTKFTVQDGPLSLRGVWIPFHRALKLCNQLGLTERLYPLFVHDLAALLNRRKGETPSGHQTPPTIPAEEQCTIDAQQKHNQTDVKVEKKGVPPGISTEHLGGETSSNVSSRHRSEGNHALQDYQIQLNLLESRNKKRIMMARGQEWTSYDEERLQQLEQLSKNSSEMMRERKVYEEQRGMKLLQEGILGRHQDTEYPLRSRSDEQARHNSKDSGFREHGESDSQNDVASSRKHHSLEPSEEGQKIFNEQGMQHVSKGENQPTYNTLDNLSELPLHAESSNTEWEELTPGDYDSPRTQPCNTPPEPQDPQDPRFSFGAFPFRLKN